MYVRGMFEADALPVLERVLSFTEARHKVLAENVANAETPSWRRRDLPVAAFQRELERAVEQRERTPGRFRMRRIALSPRSDHGPFIGVEQHGGMLRHDRNTVDLDREMAVLGRNALFHNTVAALVKQKYGSLRLALSDRGSTA